MNVKVSYTFPIHQQIALQVSAGIQNIFDAYQSDQDKGKNRDSDFCLWSISAQKLFYWRKNKLLSKENLPYYVGIY